MTGTIEPKPEELKEVDGLIKEAREVKRELEEMVDPVWGIPLKELQERLRERGLLDEPRGVGIVEGREEGEDGG